MVEIKGLIIDTPHIENILSGRKVWEMRSTRTKQRGVVALIRKGSGKVIGVAEIIDSIGPFSTEQMLQNQSKHLISKERLADPKVSKWNNAWVLRNARLLKNPVPYVHPNGAVIWVTLDAGTQAKIRQAAAE